MEMHAFNSALRQMSSVQGQLGLHSKFRGYVVRPHLNKTIRKEGRKGKKTRRKKKRNSMERQRN